MNSKKINKFFIVAIVAIFFVVACESLKGALDNKLVGDLAKTAGVDNNTMKQAQTGLTVASDVYEGGLALVSDMSLEDERILGETVGVQLYSTDGFGEPIRNKDLMLFMNIMANVIAQNSSRPTIPYHVAVIRSDNKNAYALPGGYIFVTSALILALDNEAELAVVLGHEIAHIAEKHTLNEMAKSKAIGSFVNAGASLTAAAFDSNFNMFSDLVKDLGKSVAGHSFSKDVELNADLNGLYCAYDTGYDPRAILGVLDKLKEKDAMAGSDHATTTDRRTAYQNAIATDSKFKDANFSTTVTYTGRLQQVKQWIMAGDQESW